MSVGAGNASVGTMKKKQKRQAGERHRRGGC